MVMKIETSGSNSSNMSTAKSNDQEQSPCTSSELFFHQFQRDQSPASRLGCSQSCFSSNLGRSELYTTDNKSSNNKSSSSVPTAKDQQCLAPQSHDDPRGNSILAAAAISSKRGIRWTQHLHNQFHECVNPPGGAESTGAKPKLILKLMDVKGLTIFHIKSHLQKCRIAKCIAESKEGKSEDNFDTKLVHDLKIGKLIAEAYYRILQMQLNVQKRLLQQLETQRSLQINIEEQGRQLKRFLEQRLHNENSAPHSDPPKT